MSLYNLIKVLLSAILTIISTTGNAEEYVCHAKANLDRGFPEAFDVQITANNKSDEIFMILSDNKMSLGLISEAGTINKNDAAFDSTLGLIAEPDVSGIQNADLITVTSLNAFRVELPGGDEALVYKILAGKSQIGGTFMISGLATACVPK